MTELDWEAERDPLVLLEYLFPMRGLDSTEQQTRASRLYLLGCARRAWDRLPLGGQTLVEIAERIVDRESLAAAVRAAAASLAEELTHCRGEPDDVREIERKVDAIAPPNSGRRRDERSFDPASWTSLAHLVYFPFAGRTPHYRHIAPSDHSLEVLREVFGNPIRKIAFHPEWLDRNVIGIARGIHATRDFSPMPILADALQDAGCDNEHILDHCRGSAVHIRGCWVLEGLLRTR